jgi:hypothetical protein
VYHAATAIVAPDTDHLPAYWQFHDAVAQAQLLAWLPRGRHTIVDVSGPRSAGAELAAAAGHRVLRVIDDTTASQRAARTDERGTSEAPREPKGAGADWTDERGTSEAPREPKGAGADWTDERGTSEEGPPPQAARLAGRRLKRRPEASGKIELVADSSRLFFLADECADDVLAEDRALTTHLAAEAMIAEIARVLRPGGRVLACVDSLVLGMAVLADQNHWAHLVDLPHAEVVLVPWPDGTITRCYGPDQARELFSGAGLTVDWIRPRTVFSESMVTHVLRRAPGSLAKLVRAELVARSDESLGAQLVISASKRALR